MILDIAFSQDASRKRKNNTAQNYSILLRIALNLLKNKKTENKVLLARDLKLGGIMIIC